MYGDELGIIAIFFIGILIIIGIWFGIVTATTIATVIGATGLKWWIISITIFSALGGGCGSLIKISRD